MTQDPAANNPLAAFDFILNPQLSRLPEDKPRAVNDATVISPSYVLDHAPTSETSGVVTVMEGVKKFFAAAGHNVAGFWDFLTSILGNAASWIKWVVIAVVVFLLYSLFRKGVKLVF
jgi:hypothetical protein